jgi:hypothetical protein
MIGRKSSKRCNALPGHGDVAIGALRIWRGNGPRITQATRIATSAGITRCVPAAA